MLRTPLVPGLLGLLPRRAVDNFRYRVAVRREARLLSARMGPATALEELQAIRTQATEPAVEAFAWNVEREIRESGFDLAAGRIGPGDLSGALARARVENGRIAPSASEGSFKPESVVARFRMALLSPAAPLTDRQLECLEWAAQGKSSSDIAGILGLSKRTVDEHLGAVCEKLGVKTRVQAVRKLSTINGIAPSP